MIRLLLAIWLGKLIDRLTQTLKYGGGSAAPGYYALKLDPKLVSKLVNQIPKNIMITGTNGKTTTARLLSHLVEDQALKTIRNASGSNMERGIASALIKNASLWGRMAKVDLGIWEVDEASFNKVLFDIRPEVIIFLNVFRDQLDRYGEVNKVRDDWQASLTKVDWQPKLFINGSDGNLLSLANPKKFDSQFFEVRDHQIGYEKTSPQARSEANFVAKVTKNLGLSGNQLEIQSPAGPLKITLPLPGIYQIFDFLAALSVYNYLDLPLTKVSQSLKNFLPAFGRVEQIKIGQIESYICLIKNPAGATAVFETLRPEIKSGDQLLIALNDNLADGTDVSWIWDAKFEELELKQFSQIICSGHRAEDLALRLKYAGFPASKLVIEPDLNQALTKAKNIRSKRLFVLPTYTCLLELQKILHQHDLKSFYKEIA